MTVKLHKQPLTGEKCNVCFKRLICTMILVVLMQTLHEDFVLFFSSADSGQLLASAWPT